ncbi:hybrid sensor histidine kinase/response regulator [bacterium]|nr:hybrid sensor histidine kinase/response regulator [bacterium]
MEQFPKILIVDDEPNNISLLVGSLDDQYDIYCSTSGLEAIELIKNQEFDLILLDIIMPDLNGYEVCQKIKALPGKQDLPIIFISAKTSELDEQRGFDCGAVDYVVKPFSIPVVKARIKTHLKLRTTYEKIESLSKKRSELLHMLCHDLANHFSTIANGLELIDLDTKLIEDCLPYIRIASNRGIELINTIKEMEAIEEKNLTISPVCLNSAIQESLEVLKHKYEKKKIAICLENPKQLWVMAERVTLTNSVINNLLSNAIKFSHNDSTIKISTWQNNEKVYLKVSDTGIGMSPKLQSHLFDISKKTSRKGTCGEKGTGFGMTLIQRLLQSYQGEIQIQSKDIRSSPKDHGTQVTIVFNPAKQELSVEHS